MIARRPLAFLLTTFVVAIGACAGDATAPAAGRLALLVDGLPPGGQGAVTVTGPNGFTQAVISADTLDGLAHGTYTVAAADVTTSGARFRPDPASQTVDVPSNGLATARPIGYRLASARLTVTVLGLPQGTAGAVVLTGPNAFSRTLTASTTLDLLEPGVYVLGANDVQAGGRIYRASPGAQNLVLAPSGTPATASVWYGAGGGALQIDVTGLPADAAPAITVTGPGGFSQTVASSTTLQYLDAGTYVVSAGVTGVELTTYRPSAASQPIVVGDGISVASVAYGGTPLSLGLEPVASGLTSPLFLTAPDGDPRLFIVERTGRVRLIKDGAVVPTPFLDIASRVNLAGERGLLGMAFDPSYATNGRFYVYYVAVTGAVTLERFASNPGEDIAGASLGVVMTIPHGGSEHHGGMVAFGPDGMLYFGPGDGGCCGDPNDHAQDLGSLLGKILRIDVRTTPYEIPADNPFTGRVGFRPEIWAYGLRNPWRFSFDAPGGLLVIGDVGQDAREEVNAAPANAGGLNYGWRRMEGNACFNPSSNCDPGNSLTKPVLEYLHSDGCSVTGGYVYRGRAIPELTGHYLYSDYCRGWLRSFRVLAGSASTLRTWAGVSAPGTVSFGRDGAGEMYMLGQDKVWRIVRR